MCSPPAANKSKANASPASIGMKHFMSTTLSASCKAASSKKRVQNVCTCPPNSASVKSSAPNGMQKLMSSTVSPSKVASSKKRVSRLENVRPFLPKSAPAKTPAPRGMKNFMSPTFSAASKSVVLAERSEQKKSKAPTESRFSATSKVVVRVESSEQNESEAPTESKTTKTKEIESMGKRMDVIDIPSGGECTIVLPPHDSIKNYLCPRPDFLRYYPNRGLDINDIEADEGFMKLEFFKFEISPDLREECTPVLPSYDPIKNYILPRPDFLRYRPKRSLDVDDIEVDERFRKPEVFKFEISSDPREESAIVLPPYDPIKKDTHLSPRPMFRRYRPNRGLDMDVIEEEGFEKYQLKSETPSEIRFIETKEIEALGKEKVMNTIGISSKDLDQIEIQKESEVKLLSVGSSQQKLLKKSINVNVLPKATPSRKGNQLLNFTSANNHKDYPQRASAFKDLNTPATDKFPASKADRMKHFMSPTLSAASKVVSFKKRIPVRKCLHL